MSIRYAVSQWSPALSDDENWHKSKRTFLPSTKEVAESHEDGVFAIFTNKGDRVTIWMQLNGFQSKQVQEALQEATNLHFAHKDILGEELAIGDYVTIPPNPAEMSIAKIYGFNESQVRLIVYGRSYGVTTKYPSGLVKIQPSILSS
jgi:hypothetical protein